MKKIITTAAFLWAMAGILSAQTIMGPEHPLNMKMTRSMADSLYVKTYMDNGSNQPMYPFFTKTYKHSKDNLTDTITVKSGLFAMYIEKYTPDGYLIYRSEYIPKRIDTNGEVTPEKEFLKTKYTYDADGKLLKEEHYSTDKSSISILKESVDYQYAMTDSGYILDITEKHNIDTEKNSVFKHKVEILLDKKGRVTVWKKKDKKVEEAYVTGDDGKRYCIGDTYYSYTDSGYTSLSYQYGKDNLIKDKILPDQWFKHDYIFNKKGLLTKHTLSIRTKGVKEWKVWDMEGYFYFYKAGNPHSNIEIEKSSSNVYTTEGAVVIEVQRPMSVGIYTFGGQLLRYERISAGMTRIPLSKGLYIVSINGRGYKISVR